MRFLKTIIFAFLMVNVVIAQSGRKESQPSPTTNTTVSEKGAPKTDSLNQNLEPVKFLISGNLNRLISELNDHGKLGYRVARAFNFGGDASNSQSFAVVLKHEEGNKYEYDWLTSPNKDFLESRLNYNSDNGFYPVQMFGITACGDKSFDSDKDVSVVDSPVVRLNKGDIFLLERKNGNTQKTKDYKVFVAKIGVGKNPSKDLQTALDNISTEYRPFRIIFNKSGLTDFSVSILLEDDLNKEVSRRTEYKFVKEVNGFEKEINTLATDGYRFLSGRRIGLIKYALMAKYSNDAVSYKFADQNKYEKEIAKMITPDDVFYGIFTGDSECDSAKTNGGKLVFEQSNKARSKNKVYNYVRLKTANSEEITSEINKLLNEEYEMEDVFYAEGVILIFSK